MTQTTDTPTAAPPAPRADEQRIADLGEIVRAYSEVTQRLEESHETLNREVVHLQQELASANAALQRSRRLAALGEMAAGIAHEIRNPLASIQLYANMLETDLAGSPDQRDLATKIASAVRGLDGIVNDVLAFAREIKLRPAEFGAADLFARAVEAVRPMIEASAVSVQMPHDDAPVCCDCELLHRALVNLVRNAVEAMPTGGVLMLSVETAGAHCQLTVRDTGPGIDADAIDRIFNPFFTTRATGTGLGLAIVHRIIDAHGGSIAVHNDEGAVFTLLLPVTTSGAAHGGEAA